MNNNSMSARTAQLVNRYNNSAVLSQRWAFMEYERGNDPDGDMFARHSQKCYTHAANIKLFLDESNVRAAMTYHVLNA